MTDPTLGRSYLKDVNYYRLVYQLAAQLANGALQRRSEKGRASLSLARDREEATPELDRAEELISDAKAMLRWFGQRTAEQRFWWFFTRKPELEPREERLRRFLDETLLPSTELLIAGSLAYRGDYEHAELHAAPARSKAAQRGASYRVYYNLACYEVARRPAPVPRQGRSLSVVSGRPKPETFEAALGALKSAFRLATGRSRRELVRWAQEDPALRPLREDKEFKERFKALVARFEMPEPKPKKPARPRRRVGAKRGDDEPPRDLRSDR